MPHRATQKAKTLIVVTRICRLPSVFMSASEQNLVGFFFLVVVVRI
jgi:hypothetical protein